MLLTVPQMPWNVPSSILCILYIYHAKIQHFIETIHTLNLLNLLESGDQFTESITEF